MQPKPLFAPPSFVLTSLHYLSSLRFLYLIIWLSDVCSIPKTHDTWVQDSICLYIDIWLYIYIYTICTLSIYLVSQSFTTTTNRSITWNAWHFPKLHLLLQNVHLRKPKSLGSWAIYFQPRSTHTHTCLKKSVQDNSHDSLSHHKPPFVSQNYFKTKKWIKPIQQKGF